MHVRETGITMNESTDISLSSGYRTRSSHFMPTLLYCFLVETREDVRADLLNCYVDSGCPAARRSCGRARCSGLYDPAIRTLEPPDAMPARSSRQMDPADSNEPATPSSSRANPFHYVRLPVVTRSLFLIPIPISECIVSRFCLQQMDLPRR